MRALGSRFETIVVDNDSRDGTVAFLKDLESTNDDLHLSVIYNAQNVGLSTATQQAYERAIGDWILLCNPDIIFSASVGELLRIGSLYQNCIIATEMLNADGSLQKVIHRRFPNVSRVFFGFGFVGAYLDRKVMHRTVENQYTYQKEEFPSIVSIEQPGASFLLMSRLVVDKLGIIFDSKFPVWWNDVDLAMRAESANIKRIVVSSVKVRHGLAKGGSIQMDSPTRRYLFCRSMIMYAKKWKMHPQLLQLLFGIDAIAGVPLGIVVHQKRRGDILWGFRDSVRQALAQISGVVSA